MGHDENRGAEYHRIRNIVYHRLSNFELSVWSSIVASARSMPGRAKSALAFILPPVTFTYLLFDWADKENERTHRKNPKDYENDE